MQPQQDPQATPQPPIPPTNIPPQGNAGVNDPNGAAQQQPVNGQPAQPQMVVHVTRPIEPGPVHVSEAIQKRHEESSKKYPSLNLSGGEFVVSAVKRHPIGLVPIFGLVGIVLIALVSGITITPDKTNRSNLSFSLTLDEYVKPKP